MRKKWKRNKVILPLLLSAIMVVEPVATATTVYAEESEPTIIVTEVEETEDTDAVETPVDGTEENDQNSDKSGDVDADQDNGQEDGDVSDDNVGGGKDSSPEDVDNQGESSETPSDAEEGEEPDSEEDGEEELPDEELTDEELSDEEEVVDEELDEGPEEDADTEGAENEALKGFTGMPSTYKLTSEQLEDKKSLTEHAGEFSNFQEGSDYVEGEVVTFADSQEEADLIAKAYNAEIVRFEYGILTLKLSDGVSVSTAVKVAANTELNMPAVWPNYYRHLMEEEPVIDSSTVQTDDGIEIETSEYELDELAALGEEFADTSYTAVYSDPYLQSGSASNYQWHHTVIGSAYAWGEGYIGTGVRVAVLDSGVSSHSDLPGVTSIYQNGTTDSAGHGTHVAGIIAAKANGSLGVGVAPGVTLLSGNLGGISSAEIMAAVRAAITQNADIINMSVGGLGYISAEEKVMEDAYKAGVAVFAAAGNEGGQTYNYPASYKHVISVGATDKNNERASFSSYNNLVDLSAPGADIPSANRDNTNGYILLSGTSMACPVAAGEAAVILGSYDSIKNMAKDSKRVDALEKLMKANTIKAGSGMGSGITSLTKVFKLSTAATKPNAPTITVTPDDKSAAQKVTVTIKAQSGTTIYYTTNGKSPSFKNGVYDAAAGVMQGTTPITTITISNSNKGTIKAIAVNESGVSSAVKSANYTLKPYVTKVDIDGIQQVAKGKSIQLTATVLPAYATNKKVEWSLQNPEDARAKGVTINGSNGKVTATKDAETGSYTVVATAKDQGTISGTYKITVIDAVKIGSVKFKVKNVSLELPTDKSYSLASEDTFEALQNNDAKTSAAASDFKWTSNNTSVATVDGNGVVTPHKAGKVTITALANDSSGKKATCTVTVTQLATGVTVTGPATIAASKSGTFKATVTPADAKNKKVTWELYKGDQKVDAEFARTVGVSINASGKVTASKNAQAGSYTVKAISADNESVYGQAPFKVTTDLINKIAFVNSKDSKVTIFRKASTNAAATIKSTVNVNVTIEGKTAGGDADLSAYTVSNSNSGIAEVTQTRSGNTITLTIKGKMAGKTNITVASTDGSNKKATCAVTVVNPASGIRIAPSAGNGGYVVQGKSLQMKATVESEQGAISSKNVDWELYTASGQKVDSELARSLGIKIASNGKVTATKNAILGVNNAPVKYTVKAKAKDGSGVDASYSIYLGKPTTKIEVYGNLTTGVTNIVSKNILVPVTPEGGAISFGVMGDIYQGGFTVSSSNPDVMSVSYSPMEAEGGGYYVDAGYMYMSVYKKGSATITVKAMDGSGKQVKVKFKAQ